MTSPAYSLACAWPAGRAFLLALACCSEAGVVLAQSPAHDTTRRAPVVDTQNVAEPTLPAEYEHLVQLGFTEFEAGNYAEARSRFADAYQLFPNARVLRALGKTEYELKNYAAAVRAFEAALRSQQRPLAPDQRAETERTLEDVRRYLVRYEIRTSPAGAALTLDGQTVQPDPEQRISIAVGDHVLEATLSGYVPARRVLHVLGGGEQKLSLLLLPIETSPDAPEARRLYQKWWLWTAVGVVAIAASATAAIVATRDPGVSGFHGSTTHLMLNVPTSASRP